VATEKRRVEEKKMERSLFEKKNPFTIKRKREREGKT
jgi:hypothetical protein